MKDFTMITSRKWRAVLLDAVFSSLALLATWLLAPEEADKVIILVGIFQPVVIAYISGVAKEDAAAKANGTFKAPQSITAREARELAAKEFSNSVKDYIKKNA